jgi:hypothetical protein
VAAAIAVRRVGEVVDAEVRALVHGEILEQVRNVGCTEPGRNVVARAGEEAGKRREAGKPSAEGVVAGQDVVKSSP